ncbi:MAG: ribosomal protein L7/L12, partial [Bacteroidales bacterium]|nr:ribosomal protein L7/L12 [Bacteroidales bacterium]
MLGCSLAEARDTIDHAPSTLFKNISFENAIIYKEQLEAVGAKISFESYVLSNGSSFCDLYLESYGSQKIAVIKAVKNYTGLGLGESKALVEAAPVTILSHVEYATAQALKAELDAIGSDVLSSYANELGASASTAIYPTDFGDKYFGAKWDTINYTITYNANEGEFAVAPVSSYRYGDEVVLATPTRAGYTFAGWYNNSNLVGTEFSEIESTEFGNKEFWAKWEVNSYAVTLDVDGGDINSGNVASYTYNVLTILPQDVTKVGHTFEGWFDSENQKVTQISKGTIGDVTFTAHWTAKTYSVTLQTNNGTINAGNVTSYTYGEGATLPTDITKTGYEFLGWYDNSSYDGGAVTEIADNEIGNKNFWARWTAAIYDVTLDAAGGTINSNVIERYTYGVGAVLPTDVTKTGFEFKGWKDEENADALEITTADYGDKTFTAQWEQANYSITYDANGGSINEEYVSTYNYNVGEITLPTDVTKEGNEFVGWYDNPNFTGEAVETISATEYGDKTFYAKWNANTYDVTFETNGGTINSGAFDKYTYGVVASLPTNVTKDGYTFTGWYTDEDCEGDVASIISSTSTGVKTFYAGWSNTAYAVTLYTNDGIISSGNVTAYTFGSEVQLPTKEQISKTGYTFGGWYDNASCTGDSVLSVSSTATGDKQFWAKWKVESYLITFETDGGTVNSGNVKNYIYGTTVVLPSDVTKTGYTFEGWYDNESCSGSSVLSVSSNDLGDKTFYAKWLVNSYDITFVTNEGTINAGELDSYTYGVGATLPTDVTKTGYTFDGWFTNTSYIGSSVLSVLLTETGNKTFYAKWSVKSYAVTLNANGGTITNGEIDSYTYGVGATLPIAKNVVKTGYTFNGWYDNDEFAGEAVTAIANNAVGEKTFYAKWIINTYDVTLNANGGTINAGEISKYEFGTEATLPNAVTKEGYTFVGWYDNANLTGEAFTAIANNVTGDKTFYARYTVNTY